MRQRALIDYNLKRVNLNVSMATQIFLTRKVQSISIQLLPKTVRIVSMMGSSNKLVVEPITESESIRVKFDRIFSRVLKVLHFRLIISKRLQFESILFSIFAVTHTHLFGIMKLQR